MSPYSDDNPLEPNSDGDEVNVTEAEDNIAPIEDVIEDRAQPDIQNFIAQAEEQNEPIVVADIATNNTAETTAVAAVDERSVDSEIQSSDEDYENEPEETLAERLMALSEMFPTSVRDAAFTASKLFRSSYRQVFRISCQLAWVTVTSGMILIMPVVFETERSQLQELLKMHEKKMLFGPSSMPAPRLGKNMVPH